MTADIVTPEERAAIIDIYNAYAEGLDSKNWPLVRQCFADQVYIDYGDTSAGSGDPDVPRRADDWIPVLQSVINGFDFTHHIITNHRFARDGECIVCRAYMTADHVILADPAFTQATAEEVATVVGEYTNTCELTEEGWKIVRSRLDMAWTKGNSELFAVAMTRAARG